MMAPCRSEPAVDSMNFAGMVASLLGESVELAAWTGPVLVHKVVDLEAPAPPEPQRNRPRKAVRAPQQVEMMPRRQQVEPDFDDGETPF